MTIEIHKPELEALIQDWMKSGGFRSVEDALMHALKSQLRPSPGVPTAASTHSALTGNALVAAMEASPYKEISLEPKRNRLPVRDIAI